MAVGGSTAKSWGKHRNDGFMIYFKDQVLGTDRIQFQSIKNQFIKNSVIVTPRNGQFYIFSRTVYRDGKIFTINPFLTSISKQVSTSTKFMVY